LAAGLLIGAPAIGRGYYTLFEGTSHAAEFSARAIRLVEEATVIDMLCPLSIHSQRTDNLLADPSKFTRQDFEFYKASGINLFHDTTGADGIGEARDDHESAIIWAAAWNGFLAHHPDWFLRVTTPAHLDELNDSGKIGFLLGLQNATHFRTPDDVNLFYSLGQRLSQLTYNSQNLIGTGCMDRHDSGISDFGADIVARMNEVGMAVDVGHSGDQTTLDAFEISTKPVLVTHSNVRALNPGYPRNKTDEAIKKMAKTGGVIGMTAIRSFVRGEEPTTIEHLLDHYDHVAKLVGVEHLGIGSDTGILGGYDVYDKEIWDGIGGRYREQYAFRHKIDMDEMPTQKRTFLLTEGLIRRGYSDSDIRLILGGNFKRVLQEIWSVGG
jgi:membrane dipeptidase